MKQILPKLRQLNSHLSFAKSAFTKGGFRHFQQYINGLITLNKKTVRQISLASLEEKHHSGMSRMLTEARFKQDLLEVRYLKKVKYLVRGQEVSLLIDDTLVKREGKCVEEAQYHKNHSGDESFIVGHQFLTAMIHTPLLQLPLFPRLYSKNTDSKIEMAKELIDQTIQSIPIDNVLFDSWYSDKKIINKCKTKGIRVICAIKTNRIISFERGVWQELKIFSKQKHSFENYYIDGHKYKITQYKPKLNSIPKVNMLISKELTNNTWSKHFHIISTNLNDTPVQIIRAYSTRWCIETYHRDMKQNLGFDKAHMRKKQGIVRHSIFSSLAYAILKLFMIQHGMNMTIGECITHIQNKEMDDFIREIIQIEDKKTRINYFEEAFIRKTAKV